MEEDLYNNDDELEQVEMENGNDSESMFDEGEQEPEQEPEMNDTETAVDSPRPTPVNRARSMRPKKRRRRSSSRESMDECEDGKKVGPLSSTNKEINVGIEFQATIADDLEPCYTEESEDPDEKIWKTPEGIDDEKLGHFVSEASDRYRIPIDRALFILTKKGFDFDLAIEEICKRNELRDSWTDEDITLFFNCFHTFGKNFKRIRSAMPHRSITSLVQYYYDSKKRITFKAFTDSKHNESSSSEDFEEPQQCPDLDGTCSNCGEKSERLEMNDAMNRTECRACIIYFELMNMPRPTCLRLTIKEREQTDVVCPLSMRGYMREYEKLMRRSTGSTYKNRKMGKNQTVQDITGANKTPPPGEYEDFSDVLKTELSDAQSEESGGTTRIWKKKHTVCMEEIDVLADDSRRKLFDACISQSRVNVKEVACWKNEMNSMRNRLERMNVDVDLIPSLILSKGRVRYAQNWTDSEKEDVLRCFQWYGLNFEYIADIMGTKTAEQIASFYKENEEIVEASIECYEEEIQKKLDKKPVFSESE